MLKHNVSGRRSRSCTSNGVFPWEMGNSSGKGKGGGTSGTTDEKIPN